MKKGRSQIGTIGLVLAYILAISLIAFPLVDRVRDPVNQKAVYVANDLSLLLRTASYLPESANIVYSEFLDGTASMRQNTLYVNTIHELPADIKGRADIVFESEPVPISFMYLIKGDKRISFSASSASTCGIVDSGRIQNAKITARAKFIGDSSESMARTLQDLMKGTNSIDKGNDYLITFLIGKTNNVYFNEASSRNTIALACNIQKSTGFSRKTVTDSELNEIIIELTEDADEIDTAKAILTGIEAFYEVENE